ncbi:hypothetical protein C0214_01135 [Methylobacterium sp. DM1]|nr:hypothetical protein C0214_01135 [Methylobacterium sp. DM1]
MAEYFATIDGNGVPLGFYVPGVNCDAPPEGAVAIPEAAWQAFVAAPGQRRWDGRGAVAYTPPLPAPTVPDAPTLSDWRVALTVWGRIDDVTKRVAALVASEDAEKAMLGRIARERLEYANTVQRAQLLQLKDAFGFSADEINESLWRADRVRQGDLSGKWPVPAEEDA